MKRVLGYALLCAPYVLLFVLFSKPEQVVVKVLALLVSLASSCE